MYFHAGYEETILFRWWKVETALGYLFTCAIIFLAAFLLEFVISLRHRFEIQKRRRRRLLQRERLQGNAVPFPPPPTAMERVLGAVDSTCLHMLSLLLAYPLMLIIMTYNYGFALAVILGAGLGYFLFSGMRAFGETPDASDPERESACH